MEIRKGKRRQQAEQSREALVRAASRLFFARGFQGVTVDEICREAGMTKGAFYYHFKGKDEIYGQLFTPRLDAYLDAHYALSEDAPARERFLTLARCTFEASRAFGRELVAQNTVALILNRHSNLFEEGRTHTRLLMGAVDAAIAEGTLRVSLDRRGAALLYACLMNGFLVKWESAGDADASVDWDELLRQEMSLLTDERKAP